MNWRVSLSKTAPLLASAREFRIAGVKFLAANLAIAAALILLVVQPIRQAIEAGDDALAERRATLARQESIASQAVAVENFAKQTSDDNARADFVPGENDVLVEANLQARLKAAAEEARVSVRSLQMLPSKNIRGLTLVGARLEVTGPLDAVHALARGLETDTPLLTIVETDLRSQSQFWAATLDRPSDIEGQFDVFGAAAPHAQPR
jgi:hypothetical protein